MTGWFHLLRLNPASDTPDTKMDWHPESIKHGVQAQQAAAMTNDSQKCLFFPTLQCLNLPIPD
ncbi:uncharacterized protein An02g04740 [Aspergillus niger]|uniref:Contig An02c0130, genomic contig n=2 Tax=Aspergillus niger TaxID=5061 RepID=A2QCU2_ASPNC|nr:uncharacterized protein An02g04740 [Aspergillus niger]CAK44199.1 unnamed protein product [Aspergillus niger]